MARKWFAGAESGDLSELASSSNTSASTAQVNSSKGAYSYLITLGVSSFNSPSALALGTIYVRAYVYFSTVSSNEFLLVKDSVGTVCASAQLFGTEWRLESQGGSQRTTSGANVTANTWYRVEVKFVKGTGVNGIYELKVDGTSVLNGTNSQVTTNADTVVFSAPTSNTYFDDLCIDDAAYPASGYIIARQGANPATPSTANNQWTKTSSQRIDQVWSDTPFSGTNNAATTAGSQTQGMFVSSFGATQTGHGTGTLGSGDTVNAVKVAQVAKRATGGGATHTLKSGNDNSAGTLTNVATSADWTAISTSDKYIDMPYGLALASGSLPSTYSALTNATLYIGAAKGTGSGQDYTVEDTWIMIDYTPAAAPAVFIPELPYAVLQAVKRSNSW